MGIDHSSFGQPCGVVLADGEFVDRMDARIEVHAHALSYGTGTYDGIRAFWSAAREDLYLLEAHAHYDRMHASARILGLSLPLSSGGPGGAGESAELAAYACRWKTCAPSFTLGTAPSRPNSDGM